MTKKSKIILLNDKQNAHLYIGENTPLNGKMMYGTFYLWKPRIVQGVLLKEYLKTSFTDRNTKVTR